MNDPVRRGAFKIVPLLGLLAGLPQIDDFAHCEAPVTKRVVIRAATWHRTPPQIAVTPSAIQIIAQQIDGILL
jgi:hypothetical protein